MQTQVGDLIDRDEERGFEVLGLEKLTQNLTRAGEAAGLDLQLAPLAGQGREDHRAGQIQLGALEPEVRGLGLVLGLLQLLSREQGPLLQLEHAIQKTLRSHVREPVLLGSEPDVGVVKADQGVAGRHGLAFLGKVGGQRPGGLPGVGYPAPGPASSSQPQGSANWR